MQHPVGGARTAAGGTAVRAVMDGPVAFINHPTTGFRRVEVDVNQLTGPISMLAAEHAAAAIFTNGTLSHDAALPADGRNGQLASFSDTTVTGSGQSIANCGSSQRNPSSLAGSYSPLTW